MTTLGGASKPTKVFTLKSQVPLSRHSEQSSVSRNHSNRNLELGLDKNSHRVHAVAALGVSIISYNNLLPSCHKYIDVKIYMIP